MNKIISIITINYNNSIGLKKTISSVLSQDCYDCLEYVIVDGNSSDNSLNILNKLPKEVIWISEKDRGISHAFNKGIRLTSGKYILMLNSGDVLASKDTVKRVIDDIEQNNADIIGYRVKVNNRLFIPYLDSQEKVWEKCEMAHQGTFVSKKVYDEIGGYSEEYKIRMDYHFFSRCRNFGFSFIYIPRVIAFYEADGISMRKENRVKFWKEGMSVKFLYNIPCNIKDFLKMLIY